MISNISTELLNALLVELPKVHVAVGFSSNEKQKRSLTTVARENMPCEATDLFAGDSISSVAFSLNPNAAGYVQCMVNLSLPQNRMFAKRYCDCFIYNHFARMNMIVSTSQYGSGTEVFVKNTTEPPHFSDCTQYDKYTVKYDYNTRLQKSVLYISYDGPKHVLNKSLNQIQYEYDDTIEDPFDVGVPPSPVECVRRVVIREPIDVDNNNYRCRATSLKGLNDIDPNYLYPIVNRELVKELNLDVNNVILPENRYRNHVAKISEFKKRFLSPEALEPLLKVEQEFVRIPVSKVSSSSCKLSFGIDQKTGLREQNVQPTYGLNHGPYKGIDSETVHVFMVAPELEKESAISLYNSLVKGYGIDKTKFPFPGLKEYLNSVVKTERDLNLLYSPTDNVPDVVEKKLKANVHIFKDPCRKYFALFMSPIGHEDWENPDYSVYYRVKELLQRWGICSQFVSVPRYKKLIAEDKESHRFNFVYTLRNMAVAINAKLGGTPWRLAVPEKNELVVGIGVFRRKFSNTEYIGAAFSFGNTGQFNSFDCFVKGSLSELAGSIQDAVKKYAKGCGTPSRLVIHYYKDIRRADLALLDRAINSLELPMQIPIFVVTINKTESHEIFMFDESGTILMPYSGTYAAIESNTYLLCNNTRYSDYKDIDTFPFPVKLKIACSDPELLTTKVEGELIEQVYQFSRIYWKSTDQQGMPVTVMYANMLAEIVSQFPSKTVNITDSTPWFL